MRSGDVIVADPLPPEALDLTPDPTVPFSVLYQDEDIVVVDKPAGVVVHPGKGNWNHTLVHGLLALGTLAPAVAPKGDDEDEDLVRSRGLGSCTGSIAIRAVCWSSRGRWSQRIG